MLSALTTSLFLMIGMAPSLGAPAAPIDSARADTGALERAVSDVWVNGQRLDEQTLQYLEARFGVRVANGKYWYDPISGAYGMWGGPTAGFTVPGLDVAGLVPRHASGGGTAVFVNGRELHPLDVAALMPLVGAVYPGWYWLDPYGNYGVENGPPMGNIIVLAQRAGGGSGYNRSTYGGHLGSDGQTSYFFDPNTGCSVISGGGVSC